ncbi:tetratricopeptide repeat protein [Glaesserella sp.]|uniref:tetratricopeptide repeat protein n=1 Tax=Glaesserella sp. TaxID=2094731 RepID=UPI0035A02222
MNKKFLMSLITSTILVSACAPTSQSSSQAKNLPTDTLIEAETLAERGQPNAALDMLMPHSNSINGNTELTIGYIYDSSLNDIPTAIEWYKKSAQKGNAVAQHNLGNIYYRMHDDSKAYDYYEESAKQGYASAITQLGVMHYKGHYVSRNYVKAANYFQQASDKGDNRADYFLAICYLESHGVAQNYQKAKELLQKSAKAGNRDALNKLSELGW